MGYKPAQIICDICNKPIDDYDKDGYLNHKIKIMPRIKPIRILSYIFNEPESRLWSTELDICPECWHEMKDYIVAVHGVDADKKRRAKENREKEVRDKFMNLVYEELHSDGDNNRANRIIDAADEYAEIYAEATKHG